MTDTSTKCIEEYASRLEDNGWEGVAAILRVLAAERDALRDEWNEIAAGITIEIPEVGDLWPMVSEINGSLCAVRKIFRNEVEAHNRTEAERDAARAEVERLREALLLLLDNVDYVEGNCGLAERVGALLTPEVLHRARAALAGEAGRG